MGSIIVSDLGKAYKRYPTRWSRLKEWISFGKCQYHQSTWVLQGINFSVQAGEAVGIIGVNGAGKSTLLKLITGTTQLTTGSVKISGHVAALLELGMGFHPDFTGRQNVFMAGQLLGLSNEEICHLMPAIENFAEIGEFIDQPVRVYSSGMQVRLAFSVAVAKRPDILIVDEALAVGDIYFQQKCYERIRTYNQQGTTLFFVTHGMSTVLEVCTRALYLRKGALVHDGTPKEVVDLYQADILLQNDKGETKPIVVHPLIEGEASKHSRADKPLEGQIGSLITDTVSCIAIELCGPEGGPAAAFINGSKAFLTISYAIHRDLSDPHVGFRIRDRFGATIFETNTYCMKNSIGSLECGKSLSVTFSFDINLAPGEYTVTVGLANEGRGTGQFEESLNFLQNALSFAVLLNPREIIWAGVFNMHPYVEWSSALCVNQKTSISNANT